MRKVWILALAAVLGCGGTSEVGPRGGGGAAGTAGSGGGTGTGGTAGGTAGTAGTGGTQPDTAIWPADATRLHATSGGGGELPPPPPGSDCTLGERDYVLDVATRNLTWTECRSSDTWEDPWLEQAGSRTLTEAEYATVDAAMLALTIYTGNMCGADKPLLLVEVTSSQGTLAYYDDFYSCLGDARTYVENIGGVFSALGKLTQ